MPKEIVDQIGSLQGLSKDQLIEKWKRLWSNPPTRIHRNELLRRMAYRLQEERFGGLPSSLQERIAAFQNNDDSAAQSRRYRDGLQVGTRILKTYRGQKLEVIVEEGGFRLEGRSYRSLSAIAREVTGTQRNGPAFFGLREARP